MKEQLEQFQQYFKEQQTFENDEQILAYFSNPINQQKRKELKELYLYYKGKTLKGCKNCVIDAFFEVMYIVASQQTEGSLEGKKLLRGVVLEDTRNNYEKPALSFLNQSQELLEYYYNNYPEYRIYFRELL